MTYCMDSMIWAQKAKAYSLQNTPRALAGMMLPYLTMNLCQGHPCLNL